jgi:hypothetical protein
MALAAFEGGAVACEVLVVLELPHPVSGSPRASKAVIAMLRRLTSASL